MAFHGRRRPSHRETQRGGRESIVGLAGWLFADLLLALSVVFLVAQDKPTLGEKDAIIEVLQKEVEEIKKDLAEKSNELEDLEDKYQQLRQICEEKSCGANTGLIPDEQLIIDIPGGAKANLTVKEMRLALNRASLTIEKVSSLKKSPNLPTSWEKLKKENKRIGFVILFTADSAQIKKSARNNLSEIIQVFVQKGLVDTKLQLRSGKDGNVLYDQFPVIPNYDEKNYPSGNLKIRALMFTYLPVVTDTTVG